MVGDPFGLIQLCREHGLERRSLRIFDSSRNAVEIRLSEFNCDLPHTASRVGGYPALPEGVPWPMSRDGAPMVFLAQIDCRELVSARYEGLPPTGLLSIFLDSMAREPEEALVFHYELSPALERRSAPDAPAVEKLAYRPTFHAITTIPRSDSDEYKALRLSETEKAAYTRLLNALDTRIDSSSLQLGGHPPYRLAREAVPVVDHGNWEFFLAVHDLEELFVSWPEGGCSFIWLPPLDTRFYRGRASLTWQLLKR